MALKIFFVSYRFFYRGLEKRTLNLTQNSYSERNISNRYIFQYISTLSYEYRTSIHLFEMFVVITSTGRICWEDVVSGHDSQYEYGIQIAILKFPTVLTTHLDS